MILWSLLHFSIFREEDFNLKFQFSLSLSPALLRQATYGTIKIGVYHTLKRAFFSDPSRKFPLKQLFYTCGRRFYVCTLDDC